MAKLYDGGYNYKNLTRAYQKYPTEKQLKLVDGLKASCEKAGIDISYMELRTKTKDDVRQTIRSLYEILRRNGFDSYGNPIKIYYQEPERSE